MIMHTTGHGHARSAAAHTLPATTVVGMRFRHVLVPIDGSVRSTIALRTSRALAARLGATLHMVIVATDPADLVHRAMATAAVLDVAPTDERVHTIYGDDPVRTIAALASQLESCVVCMSTHAHGRLMGAVVGSAARELLQVLERPVVMVGPLADRPLYMGDTWITPLAIDGVVVCVDAGPSGRGDVDAPSLSAAAQVVSAAAGWAAALQMSLTILHVAAPRVTLSGTADTHDLDNWMADLAGTAAATGIDVDQHVQEDPIGTVEGVRSYLAANPAGLLVVSTHARDGLDRLAHGATAAAITAASTIATLVVPIPHQGEPS